MEVFKTYFLMIALTLLLVFMGGFFGGQMGMIIAFLIAVGMNFFSYFYSDKLVLKRYRAIEVNENNASGLFDIVKDLTSKANLPMPKVYIIPERIPNAFATGRNPKHAAVAITEGLLNLLNENEIKGVIAHELSHVKHYDILIGSIAATIAGAIAILANFMQFGAMFSRGENRQNPIVMILIAIIMPIAASVIQMAISRNREFKADEGAARITKNPQWLQSALYKLDNYSKQGLMQHASEQSSHLFIVNPFAGTNISFKNLFSTHPSTNDRIARLEELKHSLNAF